MVVPFGEPEVPDTVVPPSVYVPVTTGMVVVAAITVTVLESGLAVLPAAVAVALMRSLAASAAMPVSVQVPPACTVVVPMLVPFLNTVITVPAASVEVPDTDVAPAEIGPLTTGVVVCTELTTLAADAADWHCPLAMAWAVMLCPEVKLRPPIVQAPEPLAMVVPIKVMPAYK